MGDDCTQPDAVHHPFPAAHEIRYGRSKGPWRYGFAPTYHPYRLDEPCRVKKPARIFTCSMGDLFGDWVREHWIEYVLQTVRACPQHTFQFLTKNPKRLKNFNPWPPNCHVGTTITNQADADERLPWILQVDAPVLFVSHEPLLGPTRVRHIERGMVDIYPFKGYWREITANSGLIKDAGGIGRLSWGIIGAMTGSGAAPPNPAWVQGLIDQYQAAGVPIFLKDNLNWPEKIQEWPL